MYKLTLNDVFKKDLKIIAYLAGSWIVGLAIYYARVGYLPKDVILLGAIPVLNYIAYVFVRELNNEGYREALK